MTNLLKMQWRELNAGQTGPEVKLVSRGLGYALFLTPAEMVFGFVTSPPQKTSGVLRMTLPGVNPQPRGSGSGTRAFRCAGREAAARHHSLPASSARCAW